jgi:hypothetical protein
LVGVLEGVVFEGEEGIVDEVLRLQGRAFDDEFGNLIEKK